MIALKYVTKVVAGQSPPSSEVSDYVSGTPFLQGNAEFSMQSPKARHECETAPKRSSLGDVLLSVRAPVGSLNIADRTYGIGRGLCAVRATGCDQRFLWWWFHSQQSALESVSMGATYQSVTAEDVSMLAFPTLRREEQRRIADFLDTETDRLDRLVAGQKTVAALLVEREQALLDGIVDQLRGEVETVPLRRFIRGIEQGSSPQCDNVEAIPGEWGVLKVSAVKRGRFEPRENKRLPDSELPLKRYEIRDGDLLVTRANTPLLVGAAAVAHQPPSRLLLCDKIFRIDLDPTLDKDFVALVARSTRIRAMCAEASHGTSQSMANLKTEEIKAWPIPPAPLKVQRDALRRMAADSAVISKLQGLVLLQLKVLAERRQALITAAVTGQFDVTTARGAEVP